MAKIKSNYEDQLYGNITPVEALYLLNAGCTERYSSSREGLERKIRKGDCAPNWFYFYLPKSGNIVSKLKHLTVRSQHDTKGND